MEQRGGVGVGKGVSWLRKRVLHFDSSLTLIKKKKSLKPLIVLFRRWCQKHAVCYTWRVDREKGSREGMGFVISIFIPWAQRETKKSPPTRRKISRPTRLLSQRIARIDHKPITRAKIQGSRKGRERPGSADCKAEKRGIHGQALKLVGFLAGDDGGGGERVKEFKSREDKGLRPRFSQNGHSRETSLGRGTYAVC